MSPDEQSGRGSSNLPSPKTVLLIILIFIASTVVIWMAASNPGLFSIQQTENPDFGGQFEGYVQQQSEGNMTFPYIGDMEEMVYYPNTPEREESIPEDRIVYFRNQQAAEERGFDRGS